MLVFTPTFSAFFICKILEKLNKERDWTMMFCNFHCLFFPLLPFIDWYFFHFLAKNICVYFQMSLGLLVQRCKVFDLFYSFKYLVARKYSSPMLSCLLWRQCPDETDYQSMVNCKQHSHIKDLGYVIQHLIIHLIVVGSPLILWANGHRSKKKHPQKKYLTQHNRCNKLLYSKHFSLWERNSLAWMRCNDFSEHSTAESLLSKWFSLDGYSDTNMFSHGSTGGINLLSFILFLWVSLKVRAHLFYKYSFVTNWICFTPAEDQHKVFVTFWG